MAQVAPFSTTVAQRPFTRVLIANRGEIALRVVRACHDLGLSAIAVYTEPDANADFVRVANDAWLLPGNGASQTYLNAPALIDIAQRAGAEAIHPGYGYLAESAEFAQAVIDAGLVWIGPPPAAIAALGDKASARDIAQRVGAPIARGSQGAIHSEAEALRVAEEIGYPVAIKAIYGGGGRGFRTAESAADLPAALAAAQRESQAAFGRSECLIEQQIIGPRHIETQCLADGNGTVLVPSTRDCTLQRRNQKIVEEAPAPGLTEEQEQRLIAASQDVLARVGYVGAATCEFLLGTNGVLSFMEANARIQVEHTVTEEITGVDLVTWQLRIAAGESLPSEFPTARGHSFQFRINAEDPARGFFPATGTITDLREPSGPGVRMDSGVRTGTVVGTDFDPMLAKLVVTGENRAHALARAKRALSEYVLTGVSTLLPLHRALVEEPDFAEHMSVSTDWLQKVYMPRFAGADAEDDGHPELSQPDAHTTDVVVEVDGHRLTVKVPAELTRPAAPGTRPQRPQLRRKGSNRADNSPVLAAPMQGTIVSVDVSAGDTVEVGDKLAVIEAMKMEQPLVAKRAGTVSEILVSSGETVRAGSPLVRFNA